MPRAGISTDATQVDVPIAITEGLRLVPGTNVTFNGPNLNGELTINASGGGGGNSFATIDCPSGTDPVADSSSDTLQLLAGAGLEITGDSASDSVTFKADTYIDVSSHSLTAPSAITATDGSPYTPVTSSGNITLTSQPTI